MKPQKEPYVLRTNLEYEADIKSAPVEGVADYLITRKVRCSTVKELPNWNEPSISPDVRLGEASRDLEEAKKLLEKEKRIYDAKKKMIVLQWKQLESKEIELFEESKKNDEVIKNNEEGWAKQDNQTEEELAGERKVQDEVEHLEVKLNLYKNVQTKLKEKVLMFEMYEDFLQQVVNEYPLYNCIDDVLNHYESLSETRAEMKELHLKSVKLVEIIRKEVEDLTEEGMIHIFNLSESLHKLRMEEYELQGELSHCAQMIESLQDIEKKTNRDIATAVEGIWLVYVNICRAWNQNPQLRKNQLKAQLDYIVEHVYLMKSILEQSKSYLSEPNLEEKELGNRELDKWSSDYSDFQPVLSNRAQSSKSKC